jgi:hypothetical protein
MDHRLLQQRQHHQAKHQKVHQGQARASRKLQ